MKSILSVIGISLIFILLIDLLFGSYLLKLTPKKIDHTINHNIYDHDLKNILRGIWSGLLVKHIFFVLIKIHLELFVTKWIMSQKNLILRS